MKKIIFSLFVAVSCIFVGCKTLKTVEGMEKLGSASGYTAACILNSKLDVSSPERDMILDVMFEIRNHLPVDGSTLVETYTPVINELVDSYKDKYGTSLGPIKIEKVIESVRTTSIKLVRLLDEYIDKKGVRNNISLVTAFVDSFTGSFVDTFKPANSLSSAITIEGELDEFTQSYMRREFLSPRFIEFD